MEDSQLRGVNSNKIKMMGYMMGKNGDGKPKVAQVEGNYGAGSKHALRLVQLLRWQ